jgi:uncharacterized membrane protein YjjB (DUF3815 family)
LAEIWTIIVFVIGLVISTVIIYFITKVFGEREGIKYAFLAAISGSIIYGILNNLIGNNIITSIIGGALWILVLKIIYRMKWLKALLIAFIIRGITNLIEILIPTLPGPL